MGRSANPPDLVAQMHRMQEQIRQLRMKRSTGATSVTANQLLYPYLRQGWLASVNTNANSLADPVAPRFYLDRGRVYLDGVVKYTAALNGGFPGNVIIGGTAIGTQYITNEQQSDYLLSEDTFWTNTGALPAGSFPPVRAANIYGYAGGEMELALVQTPPDGISLSLAGISWRVA